MTLETKRNLTEETIEKLQTLIRYNLDAYEGFKACAEEVEDTRLAELFHDLAEQRLRNASVLQTYVKWNGTDAENDGSIGGAVHRTWTKVREVLSGNDTDAILAEAERGEDYIKEAYEDVLKDHSGSAMNDVILNQYEAVKAAHDKIQHLRDCCKDD